MASSEFEDDDPVNRAGQSILRLLDRAADAADHNGRLGLEKAETLSHQLRAAQDHIAQLEDDIAAYHDRAERAELWLDKMRAEIEQQFPRGDV